MKSGRRWIYRKKRTVMREEMAHRWNSTRKSGDAAQKCKCGGVEPTAGQHVHADANLR